MNITMGPQGDTMFAVFILGFNLSGPGVFPKLFDVALSEATCVNGVRLGSTQIPLEPCTQ